MEDEKNLLISMLKKEAKVFEFEWNNISHTIRIPKHSGRSAEARKEGNVLFSQNNHDFETRLKIFSHYTRSISLAPLNSEELALAYGNRSAFLLRLAKYQDCVKDIDRALEITKSDLLKAKLCCRKVECLKKLGSLESLDYNSAMEKAEAYCNKVHAESKKSMIEFLDKAKASKKSFVNERKNIVTLPATDNIFDCIAVEQNDKYGRHLVAKKDYEPGDVIFVEKPFTTVLSTENNYTNCNYCLKICWSGIACDYCSWAMFCSEDCKKTAWESFHKIECSVIPFMKALLLTIFDSAKVALRMLLIAINKAGSIDKLREDLKLIDESADVQSKDFYKNGQFSSDSIQSVYLLKSDGFVEDFIHKGTAFSIGLTLITLVQYSQLLPNFNGNTIEDIIKNDDLLFIGSLLMKLLKIKSNNCHAFSQRHCCCAKVKDDVKSCCHRGSTLAPLSSLINHSCFPNASFCFTEDGKVIIYAILCIKKDSQIFNSYVGLYSNNSVEERQNKLKKYNFKCDCLACTKSWPPLLTLSHLELEEQNYVLRSSLEKKLYNDCVPIFKALDHKTFNFKKKDIKIFCTAIEKSQKLKQPSLLTSLLITALDRVYSHIYGFKLPMQFDQTKNL